MGIETAWANSTFRWGVAFLAVALYNAGVVAWLIVQTWRGLFKQRDYQKLAQVQPLGAYQYLLQVLARKPRFLVSSVVMWLSVAVGLYLFSVSGIRLH